MQGHEAAAANSELMWTVGEGIVTRRLQVEGSLSAASEAGVLSIQEGYGDMHLTIISPMAHTNGSSQFKLNYKDGLGRNGYGIIECSSVAYSDGTTYTDEIPYDSHEATPERIKHIAQNIVDLGARRDDSTNNAGNMFCEYAMGPHSRFAIGYAPRLVTTFGNLCMQGAQLVQEVVGGRDSQATVYLGVKPDNFTTWMDVNEPEKVHTVSFVAQDISTDTEVAFSSGFGKLSTTEAAVAATLEIYRGDCGPLPRTVTYSLSQWGSGLLVGTEHAYGDKIQRRELHAAVPDAIARMAGVVVAFAQGASVEEALHASDFVEREYRALQLVA